jgi:glycosyltransferase involved in cell wall biosynthesis
VSGIAADLVYPKAVVTLAGARDHYQLPLALHEAGLLHSLITDLYWPADRKWFTASLGRAASQDLIAKRFCQRLSSRKVQISQSALAAFALTSLSSKFNLNWYKGRVLSEKARSAALRAGAALFCYTTYAAEAFKQTRETSRYRFLFMLQADPRIRRRILEEEVARTPVAKASLLAEHEFTLSPRHFQELCNEPHLANGWVASSTFAAKTVAEHGISASDIHVVPYGVDSNVFTKRAAAPLSKQPFKLLYIGKLVQSKGLSYLLDAVRLIRSHKIEVILCARGAIDRNLLAAYADLNLQIKIGLSGARLAHTIHSSDVFVFPSLAEGFGHVILESMSCGVPVITTKNTCGPDVLVDGEHGFLLPIRDANAIAERIAWAIDHRAELGLMGEAAAAQSRLFTWERFRTGIREAYKKMVISVQEVENRANVKRD